MKPANLSTAYKAEGINPEKTVCFFIPRVIAVSILKWRKCAGIEPANLYAIA